MEKLGSQDPLPPSTGAGPVVGESCAKKTGVEGDEAMTGVSSKLFWCACVKHWLPPIYRDELYHVLRLTGPLLLSRILNFLLPFVTTIFCGHIGNAELAGYALASATISITTTSTGYGLSMACDTLISQTFGSKNLKRVGVILQRSSLILLLFCLPCWAILINSYNILVLLHQEDEVARIANIYMMMYLPAVPAMYLHLLQVAYLQNQGIIVPQMYTAAAANIVNLAANYVLISCLDLGVVEGGSAGQTKKTKTKSISVQLDKHLIQHAVVLTNQLSVVRGSAIANSFAQITLCLLLYGYIRWKKLHQQTWGGWSTDCLQEWGSFMKLAIPSALMICFEWWVWEIGGILSGLLGEVELASQHVLFEVGAIVFMFPLGISAAVCVRVGNALGAGNTNRAIVTCKVALILSGVFAVFQGIVLASCKSILGYIFTSDVRIVENVSKSLTIFTFLQFFDSILCVSSGILVGSGMQKIAALSNLSYYFIGLPVGIALMFPAQLKIIGFWLGLLICIVLEAGFFLFLIFKLNWKKITHKAQQRAGKKVVVIPKRPTSVIMNEAMVPDISDCQNTAQFDGGEASKADGYSAVDTQDQELKVAHEPGGNNTNAGGTGGNAEQSSSDAKPQSLLSFTQLVLRRGLTLMVSVLILAIGVAFHIGFPIPERTVQSTTNLTMKWANDSTPTPLTTLDLTPNL